MYITFFYLICFMFVYYYHYYLLTVRACVLGPRLISHLCLSFWFCVPAFFFLLSTFLISYTILLCAPYEE